MTTVIVAKINPNRIVDSNTPVVLKNTPTVNIGTDRLQNLKDVDVSQETEGSTLVYSASNNTYVAKQLDFSKIALDGGNF